MKYEQTFFLGVLADYLNNRKTVLQDSLDWPVLLSFARDHQVEGILFYQCKTFMPIEIRCRLSQLYASNLFYYSNRVKQFVEIKREFSEREIPFYTVKGLKIAEFYPIPALRSMGDCDIIVHSEDKVRAHEAMISLKYENKQKKDTEWTYSKKFGI